MTPAGLHVEEVGEGTPAIFVHGSFGTSRRSFAGQLPMADSHRLLLMDRRGFGGSPAVDDLGWHTDADDLVAVLDDVGPAHLVGHSYGGIVCLLAAGMRPERVRSLVAIEPPLYTVSDDADAQRLAAESRAVAERAPDLETEDFMREWGAVLGQSRFEVAAWTSDFSADDWAMADSSRRERWPGDAPVDFDTLAQAAFPRVLAHGGWNPETVGHKAKVGAGFAAVSAAIAERIGGELQRFPESAHNPQSEEAAAFNELLLRVWGSAS